MSPIRKSDDFRSTEINSWDEYVQDELRESLERGEFENLPDQGKPIKIWRTDVNPEYDLAFSRLRNAGVKPMWMELDHEVGRLTEELWSSLDRIESSLKEEIAVMEQADFSGEESGARWQERLRHWFRQDFGKPERPRPTVPTILSLRERERERFLEQAAILDKKIVAYHESLPAGGEYLQKLRWLPARAAKTFDDRIRLAEWWEHESDA